MHRELHQPDPHGRHPVRVPRIDRQRQRHGEPGAGATPGTAISGDAAESNGFYVYVVSAAAGNMEFRYVWAYLAP